MRYGSPAATRVSASTLRLRPVQGAIGGLVAGALFIALNSWFAMSTGKSAVAPFATIATLVQGPPPEDGLVWLGAAVHVALSVLFGLVFALLTAPLRTSAVAVASLGLVYGGLLYVLNFQVLSRFVDHWSAFLTATNQPFELAVHLVFGAMLSLFLIPGTRRTVA